MGRIRVLSDTVANKIAAGEVVERPASVVKELLENSLDAGATEIRVAVENGGRRLLRVADNGSGMLRDDAMLAFERHATSKLSDVKDLLSIATLGFRGEALPSIASVSRLVLETRAVNETVGTRVEIAGGKLLSCDEAAVAGGTAISVRDLFFNVPARKKFLRSEQTEMAHIARLVTHYSLANPDKAFQLTHGASELLSVTPVAELRERVYQVFGARTLEDLIDVGSQERQIEIPPPYAPPGRPLEDEAEPAVRVFRLRGFVSGPQVQKLNRDSIYLFVNRRLIRDRLLLHALSSAYHNLIPPACYPFALLFLDCDAEEVDVNVHPAKTEVRFRHGSAVHDFVRDTVRETLLQQRPVSSIPAQTGPQAGAELAFSDFTQRIENENFDRPPSDAQRFGVAAAEAADGVLPEVALPPFVLRQAQGPSPRLSFSGDPIEVTRQISPAARPRVPETHGPLPDGALIEESRSLEALADLRPLGQIHESFIVAAGRDGLWIVDQHVAHERILFEKILKRRASGGVETQRLLMPIVLELTPAQQVEYARIADELNSLGFETEPFGNRTIAVKAAPSGIGPADIEKVLFEILEISDGELRHVSVDDLRRRIAASVACRAAIKINMRLDQTKMEWLLKELAATDYPMSCPHGRPIALRYATRDILKSFHRI